MNFKQFQRYLCCCKTSEIQPAVDQDEVEFLFPSTQTSFSYASIETTNPLIQRLQLKKLVEREQHVDVLFNYLDEYENKIRDQFIKIMGAPQFTTYTCTCHTIMQQNRDRDSHHTRLQLVTSPTDSQYRTFYTRFQYSLQTENFVELDSMIEIYNAICSQINRVYKSLHDFNDHYVMTDSSLSTVSP